MSESKNSKKMANRNYLLDLKGPPATSQNFYDLQKGEEKIDFTYIKGEESHLRRRKMILRDHPEVAQLLIPGKPYTVIIASFLIPLAMAICYWAKDQSWPVFLLTVFVFGGTIGHTLHVCIHDFTHWGGHKNININKFFAILCNIPMGIPSAISFGKHHSDHHNFLGEENGDPDLPVKLEAELSLHHRWYKFFFYSLLSIFYAVRPLIFKPDTKTKDQIINYIFIIITNIIVYYYWGPSALLYLIITAFFSIGPHPAAIHVLAEHFEFVVGQETYDYFGIWNFFNLDLGYHIEHHDFPTCPWYNLRKIRAAAPEYYESLPVHTSYLSVLKRFLLDPKFNLYKRTIRIPNNKEE